MDGFSILYGHRMGNGEMFSDVGKFKDSVFFDEHDSGVLKTKNGDLTISVIAYAEVQADDWEIYNVERSRKDDNVVAYIVERSEIVREDVISERYILLSTCDGSEKNKRDVLLVGIRK